MSLQYVILHHTGIAEPHFDVMFEPAPGQPLRTFRASDWPITQPIDLIPLSDHRRHYLTYEGPVSGNRGQVVRIEAGTYRIEPNWDTPAAQHRLVLLPSRAVFRLQLTPAARLIPEPAAEPDNG